MTESGLLDAEHLLPYERQTDLAPARRSAPVSQQSEEDQADTDESEGVTPQLEGDEPSEEFEEGADPGDEGEEPEADDVFDIRGEKVSRTELEEGWLRTKDYTAKTTALAEQRKQLAQQHEAELAILRQNRDAYAQRLNVLEADLKAAAPAEPDWDALANEDPAKFQLEFARHQKATKRLQDVQAERQRVEQERFSDFQSMLKSKLEAEGARLLEAIPEWKDQAKAEGGKAALVQYATTTYGFTPEELGNVLDHRYIVLAHKAMLYDAQQATGKEQLTEKTKAVKVLKPGGRDTAAAKVPRSEIQRLRERARRSGSVEDAVLLHQAERAARRPR